MPEPKLDQAQRKPGCTIPVYRPLKSVYASENSDVPRKSGISVMIGLVYSWAPLGSSPNTACIKSADEKAHGACDSEARLSCPPCPPPVPPPRMLDSLTTPPKTCCPLTILCKKNHDRMTVTNGCSVLRHRAVTHGQTYRTGRGHVRTKQDDETASKARILN